MHTFPSIGRHPADIAQRIGSPSQALQPAGVSQAGTQLPPRKAQDPILPLHSPSMSQTLQSGPQNDSVGNVVGAGDGSSVGAGDGSSVGAGDGSFVGAGDGSFVGAGDGSFVGAGDGSSVGAGDGSFVGAGVGSVVGAGVGLDVGAGLGEGVGASVSSLLETLFEPDELEEPE